MDKTQAARLLVETLAAFVREEGEALAERLAEALASLLAPAEEPLEEEATSAKKPARRR